MISPICNGLRAKFPHRNIYFMVSISLPITKCSLDLQQGQEYSRFFGIYAEIFQMWTLRQQNEILNIVQAKKYPEVPTF